MDMKVKNMIVKLDYKTLNNTFIRIVIFLYRHKRKIVDSE